ncbi:hypothetical protein OAF56_02255 [Pirellulaceae bacterium]|nr:hypothetical protein [Pirellulaceae bacterium]
MLTENQTGTNGEKSESRPCRTQSGLSIAGSASSGSRSWLRRMLSVEWLAQTAASLCWIISVIVGGIGSAGDTLQLLAAFCWLLANIAAALNHESEKT